MRKTLVGLLAGFLIATASCGGDGAGPTDSHDAIRVLFIGNSLTYTNDLPSMVRGLGAASGLNFQTDEVTAGNYALIDHWDGCCARDKVTKGNYDFVVLQQGPTSLLVNRDSLRMWTVMWDQLIRASGARTALYAVWPEEERSFAFSAVSESYRLAAQDVSGIFLPVGDTWLTTWETRPNASLYGPDGFHPDIAGTYAAAVVMVAVLGNKSATSLSADYLPGASLDGDLARVIREAAAATIQANHTNSTALPIPSSVLARR